ncbi:SIMPL domain-containing protein [Gimesia algae]|uniref:Oxidative stress defense protein n=1 Tax=Gimesia algae TaxID=2527971 RepID=A0A517VKV6_9PLAN|nr:SIMPL domain-containing protein [Gimesia algae]QDT93652.1 hypothetical protein Pan161_53340 [Gimesia algae]
MKNCIICTLIVLVLCVSGKPAFPQFGSSDLFEAGEGTVSGTGTVIIVKKPAVMRMQVEILSKASTLEGALSGLKDRIEATRAQLAVLGADKESIKIDSPKVSSEKSERQQQIEMMLAQRMRGRGNGSGKKKGIVTTPLTVSAQLTAEWKLQAKTDEELLLASHPLQNKIKEADLAGLKAASKLSPEEQELMEEMEGASMYGGDREAKPGEPVFSFACSISEKEEDKAMSEAYQKARSQALRLANASGAELGKLTSISGSSGSASDENSEYGYNSVYYAALQRMRSDANTEDGQSQAVSVMPGQLKYRVTVTAGFELKEK